MADILAHISPQRTKETKLDSVQIGMDSAAVETVGEAPPYNAVSQIFLIHALFLINVCPSSILFEISNKIKHWASKQIK